MLSGLIGSNMLRAESNKWFPGEVPKLARYSLVELGGDSRALEGDTQYSIAFGQRNVGDGVEVRR